MNADTIYTPRHDYNPRKGRSVTFMLRKVLDRYNAQMELDKWRAGRIAAMERGEA